MTELFRKASPNQLQTILDLFPHDVLQEDWQIKGKKEEICLEVSGRRNFDEMAEFIHKNFDYCRQHIYIFKTGSDLNELLEFSIEDLDEIHSSVGDESVVVRTFVTKHRIKVIIDTEPLQREEIEFILPLQIEYFGEYVLLRFVTFERNYHTFFKGVNVIPIGKKDDREKEIIGKLVVESIPKKISLVKADLHKGVKDLWESGWMYSIKINFKDSKSSNTKNMNDNKGVRVHSPEDYDKIKDLLLGKCYFVIEESEGKKLLGFTVDCSEGFIAFTSYSRNLGDYNYVVKEILKHN